VRWGGYQGKPGHVQRSTLLYQVQGTEGWISEREYLRRALVEKVVQERLARELSRELAGLR